ncbi:MAG: ABC transporter permease subunit [Holosporales bacterium]|jgi:putrescine transport system permease protein|nr:ABC transporter permease subunit [Holosporales bacterium]
MLNNMKHILRLNSLRKTAQRVQSKVRFQSMMIGIPFAWCFLFILFPSLLMLKISLAKCRLGLPPFTSLIQHVDSYFYSVSIYLGNYFALVSDSFYFSVVLSSFFMAAASTVVCLIIGYAMAYGISRSPKRFHIILILLIVLPFATSFLIRVYAWMSLLNTHGIINMLLLKIGLIREPLHLLDNNFAVCLGMVYCYLPFMILPIYAALEKIDKAYIEASFDLGASKWQSFWSITFPISLPGVLAGCSLVFVPALGEFVIPELLGGARTMTIGQTIWCEFFNNRDWPLACSIAVLMMSSFVFYIMLSKILPNFTKTGN